MALPRLLIERGSMMDLYIARADDTRGAGGLASESRVEAIEISLQAARAITSDFGTGERSQA